MAKRFQVIRGLDSSRPQADAFSEEKSAPVFTPFLQALARDEPSPEPEVFTRLLKRLRQALTYTLKQRGLWWLPPSLLRH